MSGGDSIQFKAMGDMDSLEAMSGRLGCAAQSPFQGMYIIYGRQRSRLQFLVLLYVLWSLEGNVKAFKTSFEDGLKASERPF